MRRFDRKGMLIWPTSDEIKRGKNKNNSDTFIIENCYCPNGHNLISKRVQFNMFPGILLKVGNGSESGFVGLSPVIGDKSKITIDTDIKEGQITELLCPECDIKLPVYSSCICGAELISLFLNTAARFSDCIGICNRSGCKFSEVLSGDYLIHNSRSKSW